MTRYILGVDISKASLDVYLVPTGESRQFANSATGFRRLIAWLRDRPVSRVVYEPTGAWHRDFEQALSKAGLPLSRVNPLQARRFAQALGQKAKTAGQSTDFQGCQAGPNRYALPEQVRRALGGTRR